MKRSVYVFLLSLVVMPVWGEAQDKNTQDIPKEIRVTQITPLLSWHQNDALLKLKEKYVPERKTLKGDVKVTN
ncbi:MAG: hypothetical protein Q8L85_10295 [Alphaproteobacteria bacterium]|nr:hypothetical protein [Alphaproteobacteria bacterium]MDP3533101.1 hypothetical protein [Alphaproteobacteria bacterium]